MEHGQIDHEKYKLRDRRMNFTFVNVQKTASFDRIRERFCLSVCDTTCLNTYKYMHHFPSSLILRSVKKNDETRTHNKHEEKNRTLNKPKKINFSPFKTFNVCTSNQKPLMCVQKKSYLYLCVYNFYSISYLTIRMHRINDEIVNK